MGNFLLHVAVSGLPGAFFFLLRNFNWVPRGEQVNRFYPQQLCHVEGRLAEKGWEKEGRESE